MKRALWFLPCALSLCLSADDSADAKDGSFVKSVSGYVGAEVASAYLGSGGAIYDTRPIFSQELGWLFDLGDYGWIDGYFWVVSSLHDKQHESHRMLFNEIETVIRYGQKWQISDNAALRANFGPLWNPPVGYEASDNNCWGPYASAYLDNPFLVPYANGLWMLTPKNRGRIRFGVRRIFRLADRVSLTPSVETVWMNRRRFDARYGADPEGSFFGGAFATVTTGVNLSWRVTDGCRVYLSFLMFDVVNSQARRALKKQDAYYAKCDWPVFRMGAEYSF